MTEPQTEPPMSDTLEESRERFVEHWGTMATCWGINPAMGRIHGLLYIMGKPMNAEEIMAALQISRAAVSMNLKDLVHWGIVRRSHRKGDRKEYFESETDVWEMFVTIIRERKKREVDPTIEALGRCLDVVGRAKAGEAEPVAEHRRRVEAILDFLRTLDRVYRFFETIGRDRVRALIEMQTALLGSPEER